MKINVICNTSAREYLMRDFLSYLHSILKLCNQRVAGNKLKESTLHLEGHGHNQGAEEEHLEDEKSEDLREGQSVRYLGASNGKVCGPVRRSNSWWLDGSLGGRVLLVWCGDEEVVL